MKPAMLTTVILCCLTPLALGWTCNGGNDKDEKLYLVSDNAVIDNPCKFTVDESSVENFKEKYKRQGMTQFSYLNLYFDNNRIVNYTHKAYYPCVWIWAASGGVMGWNPMTSFPYDFKVLSLGLLDLNVGYKTDVLLHTSPPGCSVVIGNNVTDKAITNSLRSLLNFTKPPDEKPKSSVFCHGIMFNVQETNPVWFYVTHFWGIMRDYTGFRCLNASDPGGSHQDLHQTSWLLLTQMLGVLVFLFSPMLICYIPEVEDQLTNNANNGQRYMSVNVSSGDHCDNIESTMITNTDEYIYIGQTPISLCMLFRKVLGFDSKRNCVSRLRRCLVPILLPVIILIRAYVYHRFKNKSTQQMINHRIPVGDICLLYGFHACLKNTRYFMGGPYINYPVFFLVCGFLLALPRHLPEVLAVDLPNKRNEICSVLFLDFRTIRKYSSVRLKRNPSYRNMAALFKAHLYMLLNYEFWLFAFNLCIQRFKLKLYTPLKEKCEFGDWGSIISSVLFLPLYVFFCSAEILIATCYYGFPVVHLCFNSIGGYLSFIHENLSKRESQNGNGSKHCVYGGIRYLICGITLLLLIHTWYMVCYISITTFTFILKLGTFSYIGIIAHPSAGLMYCIVVFMILYYSWSAVSDVREYYKGLLLETVNQARELARTECQIANLIQAHETNRVDGIPKDLFYFVLERENPIRVTVAKAIGKLASTCLFIYFAISYMEQFHSSMDALSPVVQSLAAIFIGYVPHLFGVFHSHVSEDMDGMLKSQRICGHIRSYLKKDEDELDSLA